MVRVRGEDGQAQCLTNLLAQSQAMNMYASDNEDWVPTGILSNLLEPGPAPVPYVEYGFSFVNFLPYFGYTDRFPSTLFNSDPQRLGDVLADIPAYQCPSHPKPREVLDYVSNATPIPPYRPNAAYSQDNMIPGDRWEGVFVGAAYHVGTQRLGVPTVLGENVDRFVFSIESHARLRATINEASGQRVRFHHVFLPEQLPFAGAPRVAADQRHPDGINGMFFDGHARTFELQEVDPGWPLGIWNRSRLFTGRPGGRPRPDDGPRAEGDDWPIP